jgi:quinol monooxygenase YgiN
MASAIFISYIFRRATVARSLRRADRSRKNKGINELPSPSNKPLKQMTNTSSRSFILISFLMAIFSFGNASAQDKSLVVRMARLQIDSAQLDNYKAALKEHAETAVRVEPGVLTLYAVYEKNNPTHVTVFEIYANSDAYQAHLQTAHFLKYKTSTKNMVKSLELIETVPIALESKFKNSN